MHQKQPPAKVAIARPGGATESAAGEPVVFWAAAGPAGSAPLRDSPIEHDEATSRHSPMTRARKTDDDGVRMRFSSEVSVTFSGRSTSAALVIPPYRSGPRRVTGIPQRRG